MSDRKIVECSEVVLNRLRRFTYNIWFEDGYVIDDGESDINLEKEELVDYICWLEREVIKARNEVSKLKMR